MRNGSSGRPAVRRVAVRRGDDPDHLIGVIGDAEQLEVSGVAEADHAIAEGADLVDVTGLTGQTTAAIRTRHPDARLWTGSPAAVDADRIAAAGRGSPAAIAAAAALSTWLGAPAIRTKHIAPARRAIDMTLSIAGDRLPALTTRGLG